MRSIPRRDRDLQKVVSRPVPRPRLISSTTTLSDPFALWFTVFRPFFCTLLWLSFVLPFLISAFTLLSLLLQAWSAQHLHVCSTLHPPGCSATNQHPSSEPSNLFVCFARVCTCIPLHLCSDKGTHVHTRMVEHAHTHTHTHTHLFLFNLLFMLFVF